MKNITLAIDEKLLKASREYARQRDTSVNALVREMLAEKVGMRQRGAGLDHFLEVCKTCGGDSKGWKWKREDAYQGRI